MESAVVLPVLLPLLFGSVGSGRAVVAYGVVANSARFPAVIGYPTKTTVQVQARHESVLIAPVLAQAMGENTLVLHTAAAMHNGN